MVQPAHMDSRRELLLIESIGSAESCPKLPLRGAIGMQRRSLQTHGAAAEDHGAGVCQRRSAKGRRRASHQLGANLGMQADMLGPRSSAAHTSLVHRPRHACIHNRESQHAGSPRFLVTRSLSTARPARGLLLPLAHGRQESPAGGGQADSQACQGRCDRVEEMHETGWGVCWCPVRELLDVRQAAGVTSERSAQSAASTRITRLTGAAPTSDACSNREAPS